MEATSDPPGRGGIAHEGAVQAWHAGARAVFGLGFSLGGFGSFFWEDIPCSGSFKGEPHQKRSFWGCPYFGTYPFREEASLFCLFVGWAVGPDSRPKANFCWMSDLNFSLDG